MSSAGSTSKNTPRGRKPPNKPPKPTQHSDVSGHNSNKSNQPQPTQPSPAAKEPGVFQRVAETAAGVAVGSAVGNLFTSAISGLFGSKASSDSAATPDKPANEPNGCEREKLNFDHCIKEGDLTKCEELQKEYKECRVKYNLP